MPHQIQISNSVPSSGHSIIQVWKTIPGKLSLTLLRVGHEIKVLYLDKSYLGYTFHTNQYQVFLILWNHIFLPKSVQTYLSKKKGFRRKKYHVFVLKFFVRNVLKQNWSRNREWLWLQKKIFWQLFRPNAPSLILILNKILGAGMFQQGTVFIIAINSMMTKDID